MIGRAVCAQSTNSLKFRANQGFLEGHLVHTRSIQTRPTPLPIRLNKLNGYGGVGVGSYASSPKISEVATANSQAQRKLSQWVQAKRFDRSHLTVT